MISLIGDYLLTLTGNRSMSNWQRYEIAFADSTIHGTIASLSWTMFIIVHAFSWNQFMFKHINIDRLWNIVTDIIICGMMATMIDLDHIVAAHSISIKVIKNITTLTRRPPLHNTTLMVSISTIFILVGLFTSKPKKNSIELNLWIVRFGYQLLIATLTHHIRDALRRGLNLWPLPSTSTIPLPLYFALLFLFPFIISMIIANQCFNYYYDQNYQQTTPYEYKLLPMNEIQDV
ncbi:hypothetical protein RDWZM_010282 [Blomia tropicalis]|uniref:Transmembrane protein 267 n=1 Tax=Blomia tropicalis TaxID=40697 RepID=A0A9Q0LYW7_BLOTA|nr:hypothetical protein RDWZM_010282 [Blomia tropicalis]